MWLQKTDALDRAVLSWISIIGCTLSLIGILVTLLVMMCFWKNLRSSRTRVLVNLCVAIAVTDVLIVAMEFVDVQNQVGYQAVVYSSSRLIGYVVLISMKAATKKYNALEGLFYGSGSL